MSGRIFLGGLFLLVAAALLSRPLRDAGRDRGPEQTAETFLAAVIAGDLSAASAVSTQPVDSSPLPSVDTSPLPPVGPVGVRTHHVDRDGDTAIVTLWLGQGDVRVPVKVQTVRSGDRWLVSGVEIDGRDTDDEPSDAMQRLLQLDGVSIE